MRLAETCLLIGALAAAGKAQGPDSVRVAAVIGCYHATPPLTYSASGGPERGDTAWAILRLSAGGIASRPLPRLRQDAFSKWWLNRDTLFLQLMDGFAGWRVVLTQVGGKWRGKGGYETDNAGSPPVVREFTLERRSCKGLPNG